ncbi:MAG: DUF3786 domain-containing protein [Bacillota bacterium]|nr:DUF3786 domain-containing protein [Bacillota bacterium]
MDNYEKIAEISRQNFIKWDQEEIIARTKIKYDRDYFYLNFCGEPYSVDRKTGVVYRDSGESKNATSNHNEVMSIYDVICYRKENAIASGRWMTHRQLAHGVPAGSNSSFYVEYEKRFNNESGNLKNILESFGYEPFSIGDVAYIFPVFDFLPAVFQFWQGDDEFPPLIKFLWDANTLDFLHFETTFYIETHWLSQIIALLNNKI